MQGSCRECEDRGRLVCTASRVAAAAADDASAPPTTPSRHCSAAVVRDDRHGHPEDAEGREDRTARAAMEQVVPGVARVPAEDDNGRVGRGPRVAYEPHDAGVERQDQVAVLAQPSWVQDGQSGQEAQNLCVYVAQLRKKLKPDLSHPTLIVTGPALGYGRVADMLTSGPGSPDAHGLDRGSLAGQGSGESSRTSGGWRAQTGRDRNDATGRVLS